MYRITKVSVYMTLLNPLSRGVSPDEIRSSRYAEKNQEKHLLFFQRTMFQGMGYMSITLIAFFF